MIAAGVAAWAERVGHVFGVVDRGSSLYVF